MEERIYQIAIDGPSGAGKSTIAKKVAAILNIDYIDTGAMYRAIGYQISREGVDMDDASALSSMLSETDVDLHEGKVLLNGEDVSDRIRTPEMSRMASACSALPAVRQKLVELQRAMARSKSVIMDGRDIGTNVLTDARYKIYLTASAEERARRRCLELSERGTPEPYEAVLREINERDEQDMHRAIAPLREAADAIRLDTSALNFDESEQALLKLIQEKLQ